MYVSELTIDMGKKGKRALEVLFEKARERGFISSVPTFDLV